MTLSLKIKFVNAVCVFRPQWLATLGSGREFESRFATKPKATVVLGLGSLLGKLSGQASGPKQFRERRRDRCHPTYLFLVETSSDSHELPAGYASRVRGACGPKRPSKLNFLAIAPPLTDGSSKIENGPSPVKSGPKTLAATAGTINRIR